MGIFLGLLAVSIGIRYGLGEIAEAITDRKKCSECGD